MQPEHTVMITNSDSPPRPRRDNKSNDKYHTLELWPQGWLFPHLPDTPTMIDTFASRFLSSQKTGERNQFTMSGEAEKGIGLYHKLTAPTILICGHMSRDARCGILGPILKTEFQKHLSRYDLLQGATVALCSHVGGHAFAGNVILYLPKEWMMVEGEGRKYSPLAGKGVWYGRVQPGHVEGLVGETVRGGRVVGELCRGVFEGGGG